MTTCRLAGRGGATDIDIQIGVRTGIITTYLQSEIANAKRILTTLILDEDTSVTSFPIGRRCAQNLVFHSDDPTL
jgi:hypothetical protein